MTSDEMKLYEASRKRCIPFGFSTATDADIIVEMAKEIIRYRDKIKSLESENLLLRVQKYDLGVTELGKTVEFEFNGKSHKLMVTKVTEEIGGTVILEGKWVK